VKYIHPYMLCKQPVTQRVAHGQAEMISLPQLSMSKTAVVTGGFVTVVFWETKQTAACFCPHQLRQLTKIKLDERGLLNLEPPSVPQTF